jgi:hypothetical protein
MELPHKDYDLYLYNNEGVQLASATTPHPLVEDLTYSWDSECGIDDSRYFRLEVRPWVSNCNCDDYIMFIDMYED